MYIENLSILYMIKDKKKLINLIQLCKKYIKVLKI